MSELVDAQAALAAAEIAPSPAQRFVEAQLAAVRAAAAVVTVRGRRRTDRTRDIWLLVSDLAPELQEWAAFFAATQAKRRAIGAGAVAVVTARDADDLTRSAAEFVALVGRWLARHRAEDQEAQAG